MCGLRSSCSASLRDLALSRSAWPAGSQSLQLAIARSHFPLRSADVANRGNPTSRSVANRWTAVSIFFSSIPPASRATLTALERCGAAAGPTAPGRSHCLCAGHGRDGVSRCTPGDVDEWPCRGCLFSLVQWCGPALSLPSAQKPPPPRPPRPSSSRFVAEFPPGAAEPQKPLRRIPPFARHWSPDWTDGRTGTQRFQTCRRVANSGLQRTLQRAPPIACA